MALCSHFRSVKFKGLPACDDVSNSERTSFEKKKLLKSSEHFTSVSYGFHFWIESQSVGIAFIIQFFQVQLDWSRQNLSLPIEHLFWIRFRQSAKWLFTLPSLCASTLVFFSIFFKLTVLVCWMKTSSLPVKWRGEENWKLLLSRSLQSS